MPLNATGCAVSRPPAIQRSQVSIAVPCFKVPVRRHVHCQAVAPPDEIACGATVSLIVPVPDVGSFRGLSGATATFIVTVTIRSW